MRNILVVMRRELAAYFNSPIAYIFIIVFLVLTASLYMMGFFLQGQADMRGFLSNLPLFLIFFIPLMQHAALGRGQEVRHLRAPHDPAMRAWEVMAAKYLAALPSTSSPWPGPCPSRSCWRPRQP